jgi:HSP20 family protein
MTRTTCRPAAKVYYRPDFNNFINEFLNTAVGDVVQKADKKHFTNPAVNVVQYDDRLELFMAIPGFAKTDVDITIDNDTLTVKSTKEEAQEGTYRLREFNYGGFTKSFKLPEYIDSANISAHFENGIIKITLNKKKEAVPQPPKKITIE